MATTQAAHRPRSRALGLLALPLAFVLAVQPALAQSPSPAVVPPDAFAVDLSAFDLPPDASLAAHAALPVSDDPPIPDGVAPREVAARAAALVADADPALANIALLAERLVYDPIAAFELVRDSIGYDPYAGALRGAAGTLAARAGNDVDRALLLQALLGQMAVRSRLVVGTLGDEAAEAVAARAFAGTAEPLAAMPVDPQELGDIDALLARARRDHALVRTALGDRLDEAGAAAVSTDGTPQPHVWVQLAQGADWLDLDPTLPDALPGDTLAEGGSILDAVPEDWRHTVTLRVVAETLEDGALAERTVLDHELDAAAAAHDDIHLALQPESTDLGQTIGEALGGAAGWLPALFVGSEVIRGSAFPVLPAGDIFTGEREGPQVSRLILEVTIASPRSEPRTTSRVLVDRLDPVARGMDEIPADALAPLTMRQGVPVELSEVHHIQVSTGAADARAHQVWRQIAALFSELLQLDPEAAASYGFPMATLPMTVADETLVLASERLIRDGVDRSPTVRAFVAEPRVYLTSVGPATDEGRVSTSVDLLDDSVRIVTAAGADPLEATRRQVWYGVLQGALESQFLLARVGAGGLSGGRLGGVSFGLDGAPSLVSSAATLPEAAPDALADDLARGLVAVVPGDPSGADAWWSVDPATGVTRAVLAPGLGGGNYVNGSFGGGRILANPNGVPQTQAELNNLYRQALAQVEAQGRPPPSPACTFAGHEYTTLQCIVILAAAALFLLGIIVAVYVWII